MNVERLHHVARLVLDDMQKTSVVPLLQKLREGLQNMVNQPNNSNHQQQVSQALGELKTRLASSSLNEEGPTIRQAIAELDMVDVLGNGLRSILVTSFERNEITPSLVLDVVRPLAEKAQQKQQTLQQLTQSLLALGLGAEELEPGECEVGLVVPRHEVENDLRKFSSELKQFSQYLGVFSELTTGRRPEPKIRTISSSDLTVYLGVASGVCLAIATAVQKITAIYKDILDIKLKRQELSGKLSEKLLEGIDEEANGLMEKELNEFSQELLARYSKNIDQPRQKELAIELPLTLNGLANRYDRGFAVEVRVRPLSAAQDEDPEDRDATHCVDEILRIQKNLDYRRIEGPPILELPEKGERHGEEKPRAERRRSKKTKE